MIMSFKQIKEDFMAKISKTSIPINVERVKRPLTALQDEFDKVISNFYSMTGFP